MAISKNTILIAFKHDQKVLSYKELQSKYYQIRLKTGIDAFSLVKKGKPQNTFDINVLGGHSGGGRTMVQYRSGHTI